MRALQILAQWRNLGDSPAWLRHGLPNAVTVLALFVGLTGLTFAAGDNIEAAIFCTLLAALLDACDGRVARAAGTASRFGAELDSLSDVICFGAVPAFTLYRWGLWEYGGVGWLACLLLAGACALRLARFNVASLDPERPSWTGQFFVGVPAPAGAFLAHAPIFAANAGLFEPAVAILLALGFLPLVAGLMVSTWPTFSGKAMGRQALRHRFPASTAALAVLGLGLVMAPWATALVGAVAYVWTFPLSKWRHDILWRRNRVEIGPTFDAIVRRGES